MGADQFIHDNTRIWYIKQKELVETHNNGLSYYSIYRRGLINTDNGVGTGLASSVIGCSLSGFDLYFKKM